MPYLDMPRAPKGTPPAPHRKHEHRTAIWVAVISAVGAVVAAIVAGALPRLLERVSLDATTMKGPPASAMARRTADSVPRASAGSESASPRDALPDTAIVERSPIAVYRALDTIPPLRQAAAAQALFVGRQVTWGGIVSGVIPDRGGVLVAVQRRTAFQPAFFARMDSSQYGVASTLRVRDSVVVRGRIRDVDLVTGIVLEPSTIVHPSP